MSTATSSALAFAVGGAVSCALMPVAIHVARAADFLDRPREYRQHAAPTPFLGGAAVLLAFLIATAIAVSVSAKLAVVIACAVAMWLLGTLDDRYAVAPKWRILAAAAAAVGLSRLGLGWHTSAGTIVNVVLSVVWVVGLVNAFNLMDNLDGACATVAAVSAAGTGLLAALKGEPAIAGLSFALFGACLGFLPWNLSRPSKVFLGDGGSMPIGFLLAALTMATARHAQGGNAGLLVGALLVGVPILDVALVSFSRTRRGVTLVTGGRDHLTHRILLVTRTPQQVALLLAIGQALSCGLAIAGYELGAGAVLGFAFAAFVFGVTAIVILDRPHWQPAGIAVGPESQLAVGPDVQLAVGPEAQMGVAAPTTSSAAEPS